MYNVNVREHGKSNSVTIPAATLAGVKKVAKPYNDNKHHLVITKFSRVIPQNTQNKVELDSSKKYDPKDEKNTRLFGGKKINKSTTTARDVSVFAVMWMNNSSFPSLSALKAN